MADTRPGAVAADPQALDFPPARGRALAHYLRPVVGLVLVLASELALVAVAAAKPSLLAPPKRIHFAPWRAGPLQGLLDSANLGRTDLKIIFLALMVLMGVGYALALSRAEVFSRNWVIAVVVAAQVIVLLGPPLILSDVFNYLSYARVGVVHHLNPYVHTPRVTRHDSIYPYATWHYQATPYGPLFTLATYPLARLNIPMGILILKASTLLASLGCVGLLAACARRLGRPVARSALALGLNPLIVVYGLGGVHNDFFMLLLLLAGLYWLLTDRPEIGGGALVASVAVKLATASMVPLLIFAARRRLRAVLGAAAAGAGLLVVTAFVFGTRVPGLTDQANTVTRFSIPDDLANLFGVRVTTACAGHHYPCLNSTVAVLTGVAFLASFLFLLWRAWRGADPITCAGWSAVALILTLSSVMPWYLLWLLPFAVLSRSAPLRWTTIVLGVLLLISSQPSSHLLVYGA